MNERPSTDARCCAYLRRSQQDIEAEKSGHFNTLEKHKRMLEFTSEDYGYTISTWYEEIVSGETIAARDQMQTMMHELATNKWDVVFCVEASRLGRGGGADQDAIVNAFMYTNTWLITELKVYDPSSKADMKLLRKELQDANSEWDTTTERLSRGRIRAVKDGCWVHSIAPYGWERKRINRKWTLVPHPVNHERLIKMLDMAADGASSRKIRNYVESQGWPSPSGKELWTDRGVRMIVLSLANVGYVYFGERKTVREMNPDDFTVHKTIQKQSDYLICEGLHMGNGTISIEQYEKIKATICTGLPYDRSKGLVNPLAGLLKCAKCGTALTLHRMNHFSGEKADSYQHNVKRRGCTCKCGSYKAVMDILVSSLEEITSNIEVRLSDRSGEKEREHYDEIIRGITAQIEKNKAALSKAMHAYEEDLYTDEEFRVRKEKLTKAGSDLVEKLDAAKAHKGCVKEDTDRVVMLHDAIHAINAGNSTPQEINDALRKIVERIDYTNNGRPKTWENDIHLDIFLK